MGIFSGGHFTGIFAGEDKGEVSTSESVQIAEKDLSAKGMYVFETTGMYKDPCGTQAVSLQFTEQMVRRSAVEISHEPEMQVIAVLVDMDIEIRGHDSSPSSRAL